MQCNLYSAGLIQKKSNTNKVLPYNGRLMGFEPTALGTTNRCSNLLSYNLHQKSDAKIVNYFNLLHSS
jgi:hypothetical protein